MLELVNVSKSYQTANNPVPVLRDLTLKIAKGNKVAIIGKSGSGKTTLLNLITGIDQPDVGKIIVDKQPIHTYNESQSANWRLQQVGIVFQFYQLFETLTALDNVLFPMELARQWSKPNQKERAFSLLEKVGLKDKTHHFPYQLSGGEQQRVAIARALANEPEFIAADEPTGNLDATTSLQIKALFNQLHQEGTTIIMITHEAVKPEEYDQIFQLSDGQLTKKRY